MALLHFTQFCNYQITPPTLFQFSYLYPHLFYQRERGQGKVPGTAQRNSQMPTQFWAVPGALPRLHTCG